MCLFIIGLEDFTKNGRYSYGIIKDENEDVDGHISISKFSQELQGSHRNDAGDGDDKIDENNKERVDGDVTIGEEALFLFPLNINHIDSTKITSQSYSLIVLYIYNLKVLSYLLLSNSDSSY